MFSTLMVERHGVKTAVWGGKPGDSNIEYKGMAGNQVLEWADIDSEIKTALLENVSFFSIHRRNVTNVYFIRL